MTKIEINPTASGGFLLTSWQVDAQDRITLAPGMHLLRSDVTAQQLHQLLMRIPGGTIESQRAQDGRA